MELTVSRIGVLSLGKVMGAIYGALGLIFGALFTLFSVLGLAAGMASGSSGGEDAVFGLVFGIGAVIVFPLMYGFFGFVGGLLTALIFNWVSKLVGGLELEVEGALGGPSSAAGAPVSPGQPPPSYNRSPV